MNELKPSTLVDAEEVIEKLEAEVERLSGMVYVPGRLRCAKCKFVLSKMNMYVNSGTIGPGDSVTEPCPNGCGPLWLVSEREERKEAQTQAVEEFEKRTALERQLACKCICEFTGSGNERKINKKCAFHNEAWRKAEKAERQIAEARTDALEEAAQYFVSWPRTDAFYDCLGVIVDAEGVHDGLMKCRKHAEGLEHQLAETQRMFRISMEELARQVNRAEEGES